MVDKLSGARHDYVVKHENLDAFLHHFTSAFGK